MKSFAWLSSGGNRIIDVNANRLREGLKVCEDILRFHYEDEILLSDLRRVRHNLLSILNEEVKEVIHFRQVVKDLGRRGEFDKRRRRDITDIFSANLKRVEEALRVLEEFYKIKESKIARIFKEARFSVYDLEKRFFARYGRDFSLRIYSIIDIVSLKDFFTSPPPLRELGYILADGSDVIQFRGRKDATTSELLRQALAVKEGIARAKRGVKFLINDRIDICLAVGADGVHLGKNDIPPQRAREILPAGIIGWTVRSLRDLHLAERAGCDYVGCGSVFPSPTKPSAKVCGIKGLQEVVKKSSLPVVAIGGINLENLATVIKTGVAGVASVSALFAGGKIKENLLAFRREWRRYRRDER